MTIDLGALLRTGDAAAIVDVLVRLDDDARERVCKPHRKQATAIADGYIGQRNKECWDGGLGDGHHRGAEAVLYPTLARLARKMPYDPEFIARDMPRLFPGQLEELAVVWGDRYLRNPKAHDAVGAMVRLWDWILADGVRPEMTRGLAHMLVCGPHLTGTGLVERLRGRDELARDLLHTLFHTPGVKGASLEQLDSTAMDPDHTIAGHAVPELIRSGVVTRDEVLAWCGEAIEVEGRSAFEARWFRRLSAALAD